MSQPHGDLQLAIGYWIVSHKDQLRTWWAVSLLTVIGGSMLWAIGFFSIFFVQQVNLEKAMAVTANSLASYRQSASAVPQSVTVSDVTVIRRDATHVDLVAMAKNPNTEWGIEKAVAVWQVTGAVVTPETLFLNPGASRPVMALNVAVEDASTAQASVGFGDVTWVRASAASLPNPNFDTTGLALSLRTVQATDGTVVSTVNVRGDVLNRSVYNFYRVDVPVVVFAGTQIVAVDRITQTSWPTLSSKTFNLTWSYPVSGATTVEAWPQVSRFDAANLYR